MSETELLYQRLKARKPGTEPFDRDWQLIADVLDANIKHEHNGAWESDYLPKGRLEPQSEYSRRVELTPWFPQTTVTVANRIGAIFAKGLLNTNGTPLDASFAQKAQKAAELVQAHGYALALADRTTLFAAPAILDWKTDDADELIFLKLREDDYIQNTWDEEPIPCERFLIITRTSYQTFECTQNGKDIKITTSGPEQHEDAPIRAVFCHPFPGDDGIGRPILLRNAEADIAATRILSDITWTLFLLGNPILTYSTNKRADQLAAIENSASRYITLDAGTPNEKNPEQLKFVQLDATGLEMQFKAHKLAMRQGLWSTDGGGTQDGDHGAIPAVQSGVAQAWRFKTGEERILLLLARSLENFLNEILAMQGSTEHVKLPDSFDEDTQEKTAPSDK